MVTEKVKVQFRLLVVPAYNDNCQIYSRADLLTPTCQSYNLLCGLLSRTDLSVFVRHLPYHSPNTFGRPVKNDLWGSP